MKKKIPHFLNRIPNLCIRHNHACKQTHTHTCTNAGAHTRPQQRQQREKADRGKPLERQITGLDKLHFNCDHESCLDVPLVFSLCTTAAKEFRVRLQNGGFPK